MYMKRFRFKEAYIVLFPRQHKTFKRQKLINNNTQKCGLKERTICIFNGSLILSLFGTNTCDSTKFHIVLYIFHVIIFSLSLFWHVSVCLFPVVSVSVSQGASHESIFLIFPYNIVRLSRFSTTKKARFLNENVKNLANKFI